MPTNLSVEEIEIIEEYILERLPRVLEKDPRFVTFIEGIVAEKFPRRDEFARLLDEVQQHRKETSEQFQKVDQRFEQVDRRFEQVDQRFEQVDQRFDKLEEGLENLRNATTAEFSAVRQEMAEGFNRIHQVLDRIGQRWGIRNEVVFRKVMREIIEQSFGAKVQERLIAGEQFDIVIIGDQHILIEIAASAGQDTIKRLQRKQAIYTQETGITPVRFIYAVSTISPRRADSLRKAGFEVIEPEEPELEYDWAGNVLR